MTDSLFLKHFNVVPSETAYITNYWKELKIFPENTPILFPFSVFVEGKDLSCDDLIIESKINICERIEGGCYPKTYSLSNLECNLYVDPREYSPHLNMYSVPMNEQIKILGLFSNNTYNAFNTVDFIPSLSQ